MSRKIIMALWAALTATALLASAGSAQEEGLQTLEGPNCLNGQCFRFRVEIDGVVAGHFTALDGMGIEQEVIEYQDGNDPITRKRPGRVTYRDAVLKKGYVISTILNDWIEAARAEAPEPTHVSIISLEITDTGEVYDGSRFELYDAWPRSWKLASMDGKGNDVMTEEVAFVMEWFDRE